MTKFWQYEGLELDTRIENGSDREVQMSEEPISGHWMRPDKMLFGLILTLATKWGMQQRFLVGILFFTLTLKPCPV